MENSHRQSSRALLRKRLHLESCLTLAHLGGHGKSRKVVREEGSPRVTSHLRPGHCAQYSVNGGHMLLVYRVEHSGLAGSAGCCVLLGPWRPRIRPGLEFKSSEKARWLSWGSLWVCQRRLNTDLELAGEKRGQAAQYPRCSGTWGRADGRWGLEAAPT